MRLHSCMRRSEVDGPEGGKLENEYSELWNENR